MPTSILIIEKLFLIQMMYPYHNKIKQRIANGELVHYEYIDAYKSISPCLLLHFETEPKTRPIRAHRFEEYELILAENVNSAR